MSSDGDFTVETIFKALRGEIVAGTWSEGARLPTEREMVARFGASRGAVREAVASLRSVGLVTSRRGSGVFVATSPGADAPASGSHSDALDSLELRLAIETEAAGLAARRRTPSQLDEIADHLAAMNSVIAEGRPAPDADWNFHVAVAAATGNAHFTRFMQGLGPRAIPRSIAPRAAQIAPEDARRECALLGEHFAVFRAISDRNPDAARAAMRTHLEGAMARYRHLRDVSRGLAEPQAVDRVV